ncbi:MAG: Transcription initiation factor IIB 2 [Promethearchaeota archaeon]|nr:MAG: Transcription initiation factor IIB 2 [Candidatus Lokiarchaeota archaeon]
MNVEKALYSSKEFCPECNGNIISTSFERVCEKCGLVISEIFENTSYSFGNDNNGNSSKQYVALGNRTDFVGGLGTYIDYENSTYLRDKKGNLLSPNEQKLYRRLKRNYSKFLRIKNHETEYRIFKILKKVSLFLNLNKNVRNNAAFYYKKIKKRDINIINNISLIAFCIFIAAREENFNSPVTINEITNAFQKFGHRVNPRLILRDGLKYKRILDINSKPHKSETYLIRLINQIINHRELPQRLISKASPWTKHDFQIHLMNKCKEILGNLTMWERGGRNPFILTGAVIYLADKLLADENETKSILTQKLVSEATGIAEYSIRDHYVNLLKPLFKKR